MTCCGVYDVFVGWKFISLLLIHRHHKICFVSIKFCVLMGVYECVKAGCHGCVTSIDV